jgi:hypothetical protein
MAHRRDGQRLERREEAAGGGAGEAWVDPAPHRGRDRGPPGNGERIPEGRGDTGTTAQELGPVAGVKSGQRGVHRPRSRGKPGQRPVPRPRGSTKSGHRDVHRPGLAGAAGSGAAGERLRALPGDGGEGDRLGPEREGDLAGPGGRPRVHGALREREAVRGEAEGGDVAGSPPRHRDRAGRGRPGGLRRRADGSLPGDGQVPADAALRDDGSPRPGSGQSCTSEPFAGWAAFRRSSSSTTSRKASSTRRSTTRC